MKSDRETYCKITNEDLKKKKLPEDQKLSKIVLRSKFEFGRSWTKLLCSSVTRMERRIKSLCQEHTLPRDDKGQLCKRVDRKRMHDAALSRTLKCAKQTENTAFEVKVPSFFEDQTTSWIRIVNGFEKYVREAMPNQEEERASGKGSWSRRRRQSSLLSIC